MPAIAALPVVGLLGIVVLVLGLHYASLTFVQYAPAINISCLFIYGYGLPFLLKMFVQDSGLVPIRPTELPAFASSHSLFCLFLPLNRSGLTMHLPRS